MKLTCDLCGGSLRMNLGGKDASCTACGLTYSLDRLREKLGVIQTPASPKQTAPQSAPAAMPDNSFVHTENTAPKTTYSQAPAVSAYAFSGTVQEYFRTVLSHGFPDCELYTNVPNEKLEIPITFMLCKDGKPAAAIFLLDSHDNLNRSAVGRAVRFLASARIPATHFYEDYRNDASYVADRVRTAMRSRSLWG